MDKILENNFETAYKEYKEYETFFKNSLPEIKAAQKEVDQFIIENKDNKEAIADKLFETKTTPINYQNDILRLQNKLIIIYHTVKDSIEIPQEISKEIESFVPQKQIFKIENGEAKEIDPEFNKKQREEGKKYYLQMIKGL